MSAERRFGELKELLAEVSDLSRIATLLSWDQQTMMPPGGESVRAEQIATVSGVLHDRFVSDEIGRLLDELRGYEESLPYESDEASLVRVTRRDWEKERRVPGELRRELTLAAVHGYPAWVEARRRSDFTAFLPHLERNLELRRRYAELFDVDEPYDALLDDFEPGMRTAEVRTVFARLKEGLPPLVAAGAEQGIDDSFLRGRFPAERQRELDERILGLFGFAAETSRLDPTEHPFATSLAVTDVRLTTRRPDDHLDGLFATMHEGGHGLYESGIDPALERTPLCRGASLGLHESQSRMWENLVGRSLPFWRFLYPELRRAFPEQLGEVELEGFYRAINKVEPSLIRIEADEATYSLHIVLRFELEQELVAGTIAPRELPEAWNARMREYLGIEPPDDRNGVLQDVHWSRGTFGYFPTYALGNVISVQIWQRLRADLPDLDERVASGELGHLREWLRERLWRHGRKFTPAETLERVVGGSLDPEPYLRYLGEKIASLGP